MKKNRANEIEMQHGERQSINGLTINVNDGKSKSTNGGNETCRDKLKRILDSHRFHVRMS